MPLYSLLILFIPPFAPLPPTKDKRGRSPSEVRKPKPPLFALNPPSTPVRPKTHTQHRQHPNAFYCGNLLWQSVLTLSCPTDNFTHALLHIIRELAANAVRHGHATHVKVAGCVEDERLLFSVSDNGCGFDPENCPGFEEGHFGLMGVRERMEGFEGELSIASNGKGTKVTASMAMTSENDFRKTT